MLKKRKVEPTQPVHDRRSTDLLANAMVAPVIVEDPYGHPGERITVLRNIKDDILARMQTAGEIDRAQYDAGRKYQDFAELAEIGNVQAIDPSKEAVDGGGWCDVLSNSQTNAVRALSEARRVLTPYNDDLIRVILVGRASFTKLAGTERGATRLKERFFMGLEILASLWGATNASLQKAQRAAGIPVPPRGS